MSSTAKAKDDRLQVRLNADAKAVLQRAANYRHRAVSQFVLTTALLSAMISCLNVPAKTSQSRSPICQGRAQEKGQPRLWKAFDSSILWWLGRNLIDVRQASVYVLFHLSAIYGVPSGVPVQKNNKNGLWLDSCVRSRIDWCLMQAPSLTVMRLLVLKNQPGDVCGMLPDW
jgi:hypothetical protein